MTLHKICEKEINKVMKYKYLKNNKGLIDRRVKELRDDLKYFENIMLDIRHEIELKLLEETTVEEKNNCYNKMNEILLKRRKVKDLMIFYSLIQKFYRRDINFERFMKLKNDVEKLKEGLNKREYRKRIQDRSKDIKVI